MPWFDMGFDTCTPAVVLRHRFAKNVNIFISFTSSLLDSEPSSEQRNRKPFLGHYWHCPSFQNDPRTREACSQENTAWTFSLLVATDILTRDCLCHDHIERGIFAWLGVQHTTVPSESMSCSSHSGQRLIVSLPQPRGRLPTVLQGPQSLCARPTPTPRIIQPVGAGFYK